MVVLVFSAEFSILPLLLKLVLRLLFHGPETKFKPISITLRILNSHSPHLMSSIVIFAQSFIQQKICLWNFLNSFSS